MSKRLVINEDGPNDPAITLLLEGRRDPSKRSTPVIHQKGCYICEDPDFALMGLPLCYRCDTCGGHVPADDEVCTDCGANQRDLWEAKQKAKEEPK